MAMASAKEKQGEAEEKQEGGRGDGPRVHGSVPAHAHLAVSASLRPAPPSAIAIVPSTAYIGITSSSPEPSTAPLSSCSAVAAAATIAATTAPSYSWCTDLSIRQLGSSSSCSSSAQSSAAPPPTTTPRAATHCVSAMGKTPSPLTVYSFLGTPASTTSPSLLQKSKRRHQATATTSINNNSSSSSSSSSSNSSHPRLGSPSPLRRPHYDLRQHHYALRHHHFAASPTTASTTITTTTGFDQHRPEMPRRHRRPTRALDVPALALGGAAIHEEGEPDPMVFNMSDTPVSSPRSIQKSLTETDVDMDGNLRISKGKVAIGGADRAITTATATATATSSSAAAAATAAASAAAAADAHANMETTLSTLSMDPAPAPIATSLTTQSLTDQSSQGDSSVGSDTMAEHDNDQVTTTTPAEEEDGDGDGDDQEEEEEEVEKEPGQVLTDPRRDEPLSSGHGMSGAQMWVHRILSTHFHTIQKLGIGREEFPNTRLSLRQIEKLLSPVVALCNMMTPTQFGICAPPPHLARTMAEVQYWKLWESDTVDIGIFFMPPNAVIPLHNHPGMSVVTRVLYGSAQITSYDLMAKSELTDIPADELEADNDTAKWARVSRQGEYVNDSTMWLDPRRFNLHQIQANSEIGCALLDIMIPPYDNAERDCHHFKIVVERILERSKERIVKMLESISSDHHNEPGQSGA